MGQDYAGIPEEWKQVARKDWIRIQRNLSEEDSEAAGYFLQQTLEKYLKAFLIQHGWRLKKIHVLHDLLTDAIKYDAALKTFQPLCERVSGYYIIDRYPPLAPSGLECEEVKKDREQAKRLIQAMFPQEQLD